VDMLEAMLDLATGRPPTVESREQPTPIGFRNIFPERAGHLVEVVGVEESEADPNVHDIEIFRELGQFADTPPNTYEGHGHVIFAAPAFAELDDRFAQLVRDLRLETDGRRPQK